MRDIWDASHTPRMPLALVVDDEPNIRALIEVTLQMEGFETVSAPDGISALEQAATRRPDVITLDVMMPGMDGWEVARRLDGSGIPIVVLSGKAPADLESAPDRKHATAVLPKPFDFNHLVEVVQRAVAPAPRPAS
jgi:CheY-like chemotaxis protein